MLCLTNFIVKHKNIAMNKHGEMNNTSKLFPRLSGPGYPTTLKDLNRRFLKFVKNPGFGVAVYDMNKERTGFVAQTTTDCLISHSAHFSSVGRVVSTRHKGADIDTKPINGVKDNAHQDSQDVVDLPRGLTHARDGTYALYPSMG
jgi:hypothetical protein